jgi:hypothetical protein
LEKLEAHDLGTAQTAPGAPEQEFPAPDIVDELLATIPATEGRAEPQAPEAVQPGARSEKNPPSARQTPVENAARANPAAGGPSAPSSQTRLNDGAITSSGAKPSVKAFLENAAAQKRAKQREPKPSEKSRQQGKAPKQARKKSKPKREARS